MSAAPKKKKCQHTIMSLNKRIETLEAHVIELLKTIKGETGTKRTEKSIQKVEDFNGEDIPAHEAKLKMNAADQLRSMVNAIKILPPNYIDENSRHSMINISAVCGFPVTTDMHDELYSKVKHQAGVVVDIK